MKRVLGAGIASAVLLLSSQASASDSASPSGKAFTNVATVTFVP